MFWGFEEKPKARRRPLVLLSLTAVQILMFYPCCVLGNFLIILDLFWLDLPSASSYQVVTTFCQPIASAGLSGAFFRLSFTSTQKLGAGQEAGSDPSARGLDAIIIAVGPDASFSRSNEAQLKKLSRRNRGCSRGPLIMGSNKRVPARTKEQPDNPEPPKCMVAILAPLGVRHASFQLAKDMHRGPT